MTRIFRLLSLFALLSVLTATSVAQVATAELHVTVKDQKGAVVKNATVTVRNQATSQERSQSTNLEGEYPFRALPPGKYNITVEAAGFARSVAKDVTITVGQIAELPILLQVASANEVVNVTSEAELIETQRSSSATTVDETRIENLPINGRNYINFALTNSQLARDTAPSIGAAPTSGLNVGGQRARGNLVNVDGMDAVDNSTNGIRSTVSQEAVQEFQLITNGYNAEYGRASGGIVNIITKSGTNDLHGSAYGYLRNRAIQAVNPFSTVTDPGYTRTQAGFTLGGPIKKDKTFFFLSYELTRRHETGFSSIGKNNFDLTLKDVTALMAPVGAPAGSVVVPLTAQQIAFYNQASTQQLLAGRQLGLLNPTQQAQVGGLQQYYGLAGFGAAVALTGQNPSIPAAVGSKRFFVIPDPLSGNPGCVVATSANCLPTALPASFVPLQSLIGNFPVNESTDLWSARIDHQLTPNQTLLFRAGVSPSKTDGIQVNAQGPQNFGQNAFSRTSRQDYHDWSGTVQHNWTLGNNKVNEFRFQYSRRGLLYSFAEAPGGSNVGVNIVGYSFFGREPFSFVKRTEERFQFTDNFSYTKGKHNLKWGGDYNHLPLVADFTVNFGGVYNFSSITPVAGLPSLSPVQAYGVGIPSTLVQGVGNPHDEFTNKVLGMFFQDSWAVTRNLTLNMGLRYDVEFTPVFPATTALAQKAQDLLGITQGIPRDYNNFAPRFGFAWDPRSDGKTVVRGSFGMFYDHPLLGLAFDSDVADASQAPQILLFGSGALDNTCGLSSLNATNSFTGRLSKLIGLNCGLPTTLNYLPNEQRFNPAPGQGGVWTNQQFLTGGLGGAPVPLTMLPFGFPTGKGFQYAYSNQVNFGIEHDLGHNMSVGVQYNFNGGRHLNRPINNNAVHGNLLVKNWQNAIAAGAATTSTNPLSVSACGVGPTGPYVPAALVGFFRPSGINPALQPYVPAACVQGVAIPLLKANGLGFYDSNGQPISIPFSDAPANYSSGSSVYHGFTANLKKRFSNHYEFLASYTWSHAIDDSTDLQSPLSPQDSYDLKAERSTSLFDQRHRFVFSAVYNSGRVNGGGFKKAMLSDWTIAPIIEYGSGRPFNILTVIPNNFQFSPNSARPSTATAGQVSACGDVAAPSQWSPTGYLIPPCFANVLATGQMDLNGNLGRNAGVKPSVVFTDIRLARRFSLTERVKLEGVMDVFNFINKNNVADVNPLWDKNGVATAAFDPRQFQFALRVTF